MRCVGILFFGLFLLRCPAWAVPSIYESVMEGVYVVRDDNGQWGGHLSNSITHQNSAPYLAKKVLDLSDVPVEVWHQTQAVRLSACIVVRDYSWHDNPPANGLDESFEIIVNGKAHRYPTNCGAPIYGEGKSITEAQWFDFALPKEEFQRGVNEIVLHKAEGNKNDDYLYLLIDNSVKRGNSYVAFDGKAWTQDRLTIPGGNGEYMVRLYLLTKDTRVNVDWRPGLPPRLDDPAKLILYSGAQRGEATVEGLRLPPGDSARVEWHSQSLDMLEPLKATVDGSAAMQIAWLDENDKPTGTAKGEGAVALNLPANRALRPSGLLITAGNNPVVVRRVTLEAAMSYHPLPKKIDMCPPGPQFVAQPKRAASRQMKGNTVILENASDGVNQGLRCEFETRGHVRLVSLYNHNTKCEMLLDPSKVYLFLVEVNGKRYAGSRDFHVTSVKPLSQNGFIADLALDDPPLKATLTVRMENEGLRMGMSLTNAGKEPIDFKLAFPHLSGLTASGKPAEDYYFFPWGGGIIADTPAVIRRGYGDHEALYQVMDLYSPKRCGGLYIRVDDREGWHKTLALRKHIPGTGEVDAQRTYVKTTDDYKWTNPFEAVEGTGFAYEYLRRTRKPGESFAPAEAVLASHWGDWQSAMKAYADWAHRVWKFRSYPSRLHSIHNMIADGWGQGILFKDGKYRTDIVEEPKPGIGRTRTDCIELMSWWDWSPLGPWSTPFDKLKDVLTSGEIKAWEPYFVKDPVTGQMMWNNQPGDYDGYNERFGGLPAFRKAIQTYKDMGALVTLYTDPFRLDDASKTGKAHGKEWGVVGSDGKLTTAYEVWNPCHDLADVRQWVADSMKRVMRETGADGIRLDEYGHAGWACFSDQHKHTYEERGVSQWLKATAETTRMVHAAMDEVKPGLVLTTEHPGYDYLMQYLDGCITYDMTVQACPLRPLEVNTQRFYFPECKAYELDHRGADLDSKKKFWNAVESFGRYYPSNMYSILNENEDVYQSRNCVPLVHTPGNAQYVYVNRFAGGGKTFYHLYNATGHTFEGTALSVGLQLGDHLFDMLNCQEVSLTEHKGEWKDVHLYLTRDDVACLVQLPKRLTVQREGNLLTVEIKPASPDSQLALFNLAGETLLTQDAKTGKNVMDLSKLPADKKPACVKLLRGGSLVDVMEIPGVQQQ